MASSEVPDPPRRNPKTQIWKSYKDEIYQTYMVENRTLSETMQIFELKYGLKASVRTWKMKLCDWGFDKYITKKVSESMYLTGAVHSHVLPALPVSNHKEKNVPKRKRILETAISDAKKAKLDLEPQTAMLQPITPPPSEPSPVLSALPTRSMSIASVLSDPAEDIPSHSLDGMKYSCVISTEEDLTLGIYNLQVTPEPSSPTSLPDLNLSQGSISDVTARSSFEDYGNFERDTIKSNNTFTRFEIVPSSSELQPNQSRKKRRRNRRLKIFQTLEKIQSIPAGHEEGENWGDVERAYVSAIHQCIKREGRGSLSVYNVRAELVDFYNRTGRRKDAISISRVMIAEHEAELGRSVWMTLQATEHLAEALAYEDDFLDAYNLFKKAIDGYEQHNHISDRLQCQHTAANVSRQTGHSKEALVFLQGALVTWLCFQPFRNPLGVEILVSLQELYKQTYQEAAWGYVSGVLSQVQDMLKNEDTSSNILELSCLEKLAQSYSSADEFDTAEALFTHCLRKMQASSDTRSSEVANLYFQYAKHSRRANREHATAIKYLTLALEKSLSLRGSTSEEKAAIRGLLDEIRFELIKNDIYNVSSILTKTLGNQNHISSFLNGEWLESSARLERFYQRRMMKRAHIISTSEFEHPTSDAVSSMIKSSSGIASTFSGRSIGVTYSENDFLGFDVMEVSKVHQNLNPSQIGSRPHYQWPP